MMLFDPYMARQEFPALERRVGGKRAVYLDGPGGTQVTSRAIASMTDFMEQGGSNLGGPFETSMRTGEVVEAARHAVADLFNADSGEIAFAQNMTSHTLAVSRALAKTWNADSEIVVSRLDHDANVSPWLIAAESAGATVKWVDFDPFNGCEIDMNSVEEAITDRTRLVAITCASNAVGTTVDVAAVASLAHEVGALVYADAVHYAPHGPIDVGALGCDFLVASAYKFFGPHTGCLWGRRDLLAQTSAVKIRPAPSDPPDKFETGTQSFESLAAVTGAIDYLATLGAGESRRQKLADAMGRIARYEAELSTRFLEGIGTMDHVSLYGEQTSSGRTPTFGLLVEGMSPRQVAEHLGTRGIFVWDGHYYALEVMDRLGLLASGGLVRVGFVHYNTPEEVDRTLEELEELAPSKRSTATSSRGEE